MKKILLKTPFARPLKKAEALFQKSKIFNYSNNEIVNNKTTYCISPYKTGTTFLSSGFDSKISDHEPMHYLSLCELENNFNNFFIKKLNFLDLKLECSGVLSAYIDELNSNEIAKNLDYICILREPSKWVSSVLNYWQKLDYLAFDYINDLFWKDKVGVNLIDFNSNTEKEKIIIINNLIEFYLNFTQDTFKIKNIRHVQINNLEDYAKNELSVKLGENFNLSKVFKRENKKKKIYNNINADEKYKQILLKEGIK